MTLRLAYAALILFALAQPVLANGNLAYVAGIGDLPLMEGLIEDPDAAIIYDKPEGRIVEAVAYGHVSSDDVVAFYNTALVQLGWQATGEDLTFAREGEVLVITVDETGGNATVSFSLAPR
jgi:hypothetical protein